jgi:hypothetical protein
MVRCRERSEVPLATNAPQQTASLEANDWDGSEFFDWTRFDYFMKRTTLLMNRFAQFKLLFVKAVGEQKGKSLGP